MLDRVLDTFWLVADDILVVSWRHTVVGTHFTVLAMGRSSWDYKMDEMIDK